MKEATVTLEIVDYRKRIETWTRYEFDSHFLTPSDSFHFTIGSDKLQDEVRTMLRPGVEIALYVDGHIQATGYIDSVESANGREGGTEINISGRDKLSLMVDSNIDPRLKFPPGTSLSKIITDIAAEYGFPNVETSNEVNRDARLGKRGLKTTKKGTPLKSVVGHQLQPYPTEGAYAFLSRVTQRHGLWVWPSADGQTLIVSKPHFANEAPERYCLVRNSRDGAVNNVLHGSVTLDFSDQPSVIMADGFAPGAPGYGHSKIKAHMFNPFTSYDDKGNVSPEVFALTRRHPESQEVLDLAPKYGTRFTTNRARPVFLHDDESKTREDLEKFVRRQMSLHMRKAVTATYTVAGHLAPNGEVWSVDTTVNVADDFGDLHQPMYIVGRTFHKSRSGGTTTTLKLIHPFSLVF